MAQDNSLDRSAMLSAVNAERTARGLAALSWNNWLESAALRHTRNMSNVGFLSHTGSDGSSASSRVTDTGYQWTRVTENIAQGYTSVSEVMTGWMNSSGHRTNILDAGVTEIGAARVGNYWTQVFAAPTGGTLGQGGNSLASDGYYASALTMYSYFYSIGQYNLANAYYFYYSALGDWVRLSGLDNGTNGLGRFAAYRYYLQLGLFYYYYFTHLGNTANANYYYGEFMAAANRVS